MVSKIRQVKVKMSIMKGPIARVRSQQQYQTLRYRVIQYLIGKLLDMVKMGQDSLVVAALLASVRAS